MHLDEAELLLAHEPSRQARDHTEGPLFMPKWRAAGVLCVSFVALSTWAVRRQTSSQHPHVDEGSEFVELQGAFGAGATVEVFQSSQTGERLAAMPPAPLVRDFPFDGPSIVVDAAPDGLPFLGFGGAFTEASAVIFEKLNPGVQETFLNMYFGADGLQYNLGRVHINSCDFAESNYNFDDVPNDFSLSNFDDSLARDARALIPMIQRAQAKVRENGRELKMMATPWSPPGWMKTNGQMDRTGDPGLRDDCQDVWARYISRWISGYMQHGIPIWAISVQNEPTQNSKFESCEFHAEKEADFLANHLGPTLRADHPEVGVFIFDHNKKDLVSYSSRVMQNGAAAQFVTGMAFHWYTGDFFEQVTQVRQAFPEKMLISSEATWEKYRWLPGSAEAYDDWRFGVGYAHTIIGDFNAGARGWIDWNLMLDEHGGPNHVGNVCDAAMIGNVGMQTVSPHSQYFFIGHFSKFIPPNSMHLNTFVQNSPRYAGINRQYGECTDQDGLEATSFQLPDGTRRVVTVVLNCFDRAVDFKVQWGPCAFKSNIPAKGIQTFRYSPMACVPPR